MSEISQEKNIQKHNQDSPSSKPSIEKTTSKSFQSEAISTIQNSADSKEFLSNSNNLNSLFSSKSKNKENIPQQKTLNNFVIDDNINKNKIKKNNIEQNDKIEEKEKEKENNMKNEENLEKFENLFLQKKRLMKKSDIVLKNKLLKKLAKNYFDKEAELGSDNEEHDEVVKKVYHSDSDSEKENDKNANDIENLIDNDEKEDYVQNKKFFDDMIERDHEEILQVIEGPKKRIVKEAPKKIVIDDNGLSLKVRMERMNDINLLKEEEDENKFKNIESKLKQLKKQFNEDETNEEIKEMIEINNSKLMKQINIMTGQQNKSFKQHLEENKEILKNVIQNDDEDPSKKEENKDGIIVKGNGAAKLGNKKFKPFCGMGKFGNCKNSLLSHIKKEKNSNNSNGNLNQKNTTSFHSNLKLNSNNEVRYNGNLKEMLFRK